MRLSYLAPLAFLSFASSFAAPADRIAGPIDATRLHAVSGSVHRLARPQFDRGTVASDLQLDHVQLFIKPSTAQQDDLDQLLRDQQNPSSANYRHWLTPEEYAGRFGLSPRDHAKIVNWLKSEGVTVQESSRGRNWISFAGSAAQVSKAFHTSIHTYEVNGEARFANSSDPSVPEAIAGLVSGFAGLNNFRPRMNAHVVTATPDFTSGTSHYLSPADFATIYDIQPLYTAGYDGTGQSIAVVGVSDISVTDIRGFRSDFGLPALDPKQLLYGTDPGFNGAQIESDLDIEWSGAIAKKATIYYVFGQDAFTAFTVAVSASVAPIISISFGYCENDYGLASWRTVAQEANAQGITVLNSSGDSGAAGCDIQGDLSLATHGPSVAFPADLPEVTGVGGTMFNEGSGVYWNSVNSLTNGTALSYIPELAWNETSVANGLSSGGGGASRYFSKPDWQTGPGVPADGARDVPDVALSAAIHDSYLITLNSGTGLIAVAGTSAASPSMAGILALLNQYVVKQGIQKTAGVGNINPQLYRLAQVAPAAFHDISGGNNIVPCEQGTTGCLTGSVGYTAGAGYDQASGLGSVDANVFVTSWNTATSAAIVSATASPATVTLNGTVTVTATVASGRGKGTPTGTVNFEAYGVPLGSAILAPVNGVQTAAATFPAWMLSKGTNSVYAAYSGDSAFSGASATVRVQVTLPTTANTAAVVPTVSPNPVYADPAGNGPPAWQTNIVLSELAGIPAVVTGFTLDGQAQSLAQYFPSVNIPASGKLQSSLVLRNLTVPATHVLGFAGTDAGGNQWSRQVPVQFVGGINEALEGFNMWVTPLAMLQNTAASASCQWSQQLVVDGSGYEQRIVALQLGPVDISGSIASVFGTTRLAPWGSLQGTVCWNGVVAPASDYLFIELEDDFGDVFEQTAAVTFSGPPTSSIQLSLSPASLTLKPPTVPGFQTPVSFNINLSDKSQPWTAAIYPSDQTAPAVTSWLQLSQYSGTGPASVTLQATATGFAPGVYRASIVVQSPLAMPEWVSIPVMWINSPSPQGPVVSSVSNALSFTSAASPGMLLAIYGSQLATLTQVAGTSPLPNSMGGVSATVNGWPAPLLFVSPTQINLQVPYEAGAGLATLGINNNGEIGGYLFPITPSAPGIFNGGGTAKQGAYTTIYMTGVGDVSPALATGFAVGAGTKTASLPLPLLPLSVTVGGIPALVQFAGLPQGVIGLAQVNFIVPPTVAPGTQPVVVTVNGVASAPVNIIVTAGS